MRWPLTSYSPGLVTTTRRTFCEPTGLVILLRPSTTAKSSAGPSEHCQLKGVYALHQSRKETHETVVPLVYVCEAKNDDDAERIHRLVWNQNIAPFLIVVSQKAIRLYSGFRYERAGRRAKTPSKAC